MAKNLRIDESLLQEAFALSGFRTKEEAVNLALKEFVLRRRQRKILQLQGAVDFDPTFDHKEQRKKP